MYSSRRRAAGSQPPQEDTRRRERGWRGGGGGGGGRWRRGRGGRWLSQWFASASTPLADSALSPFGRLEKEGRECTACSRRPTAGGRGSSSPPPFLPSLLPYGGGLASKLYT